MADTLLDQSQVQLTVLEALPEFVTEPAGHLQANARPGVGKPGQHRRERLRREILRHAQTNLALA